MNQKKLTVTIIAFNEESNIKRAIISAQFADEILVVDSQSSDQTREIAESLGVKVIIQPFLGYGQQKNFAEKHALGDWIFNLDADEAISEELKNSIKEIMAQDQPLHDCYQAARLNHYCGKPIYHGGWYPDHNTRLYLKGKARWTEPSVHEELRPLHPQGKRGLLVGPILHYSFPSVKSQVQTNILYASLGAQQLLKKKKRANIFSLVYYPCIKFIECYFLKLGFLDGVHGFVIAVNAAHSSFMKYSFAYLDYK